MRETMVSGWEIHHSIHEGGLRVELSGVELNGETAEVIVASIAIAKLADLVREIDARLGSSWRSIRPGEAYAEAGDPVTVRMVNGGIYQGLLVRPIARRHGLDESVLLDCSGRRVMLEAHQIREVILCRSTG